MTTEDGSYTDAKGRLRWRVNDELAGRLSELADFLVVGGYDESHAARYPRLAYTISRMSVPITTLCREQRLDEIPGVGDTVATIISQLVEAGTCDKFEEWAETTPLSLLEIIRLPGLGAKSVRTLYSEYGITDMKELLDAVEESKLETRLASRVMASLRKAAIVT